jgi:signal transduction histidine kinase
MIIGPRFLNLLFLLIVLGLMGAAILFVFWKKFYSRLSARIAVLVLTSGLVTLVITLVFNELTSEIVPPSWMRLLQIAVLVLGPPLVLGLLALRFVRQPLRQFSEAIASLKQSNYKVRLQLTGIGEFDEVFKELNDLTNRLRREEKLRKDLVSDTSHELNTPLTTMIGQLTAIQEGKYSMTEERVAILKEQAERLAELVRQLDAYTRARMPDAGEPETLHLKQFCEEFVRHFSLELKAKGITVTLNIKDDAVIHASRSVLRQVLTNLVQNTLRYSQATEIIIEATADKLSFSDNGKGVPTRSLPHLFERFYRVDKSRNRETGGLGLGLAIVKEITEQQGWQIHAKNTHPGLGFTLTF